MPPLPKTHWRWINAVTIRRTDGATVKRVPQSHRWEGVKDGEVVAKAFGALKAMEVTDEAAPIARDK